ncbi:hypothetical protein L9F63_021001, partial [Diploptera punctata]
STDVFTLSHISKACNSVPVVLHYYIIVMHFPCSELVIEKYFLITLYPLIVFCPPMCQINLGKPFSIFDVVFLFYSFFLLIYNIH